MNSAQSTTPSQLRAWAQDIIGAALESVEPAQAVRAHLQLNGTRLLVRETHSGRDHTYDLQQFRRVLVVGGGKAGAPMAAATADILGSHLAGGSVIVKYGHSSAEDAHIAGEGGISILEAGHPIPDEAGLLGAAQIAALLEGTTEHDLVVCVLSGGGSSLLTLPVDGISLADVQSVTNTLLGCGATINEINTIRKHLSRLKGGGLARLAAPATVICLILSDVVGDPLDVIASGPTVPDPTTFTAAWDVVEKYDIAEALPPAVIAHLQRGLRGEIADTPKPDDAIFGRVTNVIIGSNRLACTAAARRAHALGLHAGVLTTFLEGEAREVGTMAAGLAKGLVRDEMCCPWPERLPLPACLILGGETTVTLRGNGKGGRNTEAALAAAVGLAGWQEVLVVFLGTDGSDGPTDAAGAFADGSTVQRAECMGVSALEHLSRNDSYNFFQKIGDLIITGPTRTNVNDLILVLAGQT